MGEEEVEAWVRVLEVDGVSRASLSTSNSKLSLLVRLPASMVVSLLMV